MVIDPLQWSFEHFARLDESNAAIHCSPVRWSPITFRLAAALQACGAVDELTGRVIADVGRYPEDRGRIELDEQ